MNTIISSLILKVFGFCIILSYSCAQTGQVPESELYVLQDVYNSTNGPNWFLSNINTAPGIPWNMTDIASQNPCVDPMWYGVVCSYNESTGYNHISELLLYYSELSGTIPNSIGNLPYLETLNFGAGIHLHGTIPNEVTNLINLKHLFFAYNFISGTIPQNIGNLQKLERFDASINLMSGPIPNSLTSLSTLTDFSIQRNTFTGTIPADLGYMINLKYLVLQLNQLNGTIPNNIGNLTNLIQVYIGLNFFTGTIPKELGKLVNVGDLYLYDCLLTGTIPSELFNLQKLVNLNFFGNYLSGTIPNNVGNLSQLVLEINLNDNMLTGTIPSGFGMLKKLSLFWMYANRLSGSIPSDLGNMAALTELQLYWNDLTGTLPPSLSNNSVLTDVGLFRNYLTGTIPSEYSRIRGMKGFVVNKNILSGTIPHSFKDLGLLQSLYLQYNAFSGSIVAPFNSSAQHSLAYVSLAYNQFTGQIPSELFRIASIQEVDLVSNCLSGTVPDAICEADKLTLLLLDGASSGYSCQRQIFPFVESSTAYYLTKALRGTIPQCLFNMTAVQTLHLSGNSLTGSISSDVTISPSLQNLVLSHNLLTNSVATVIQQREWLTLDLSFNKLNGVLGASFRNSGLNSTISLQDNRFSGEIPQTLTDAENIQLVSGNMFSCGIADRDSLPSHDSDSDNYQCGSNTLDLSMYITILIGVSAVTVVSTLLLCKCNGRLQQIVQSVRQDLTAWNINVNTLITLDNSIGHYLSHLKKYRQYVLTFAVLFCLCVFLPTYGVLSVFYSTYKHTYAWAVSAAFKSGFTAGVVMFSLWVALVVVLLVACIWLSRKNGEDKYSNNNSNLDINYDISSAQSNNSFDINNSDSTTTRNHMVYLSIIGILLVNLVVVLGINVFYVWVTLNASSQPAITATEIFVALFKLVWNDLVVSRLFIYAHASQFRHHMVLRIGILLFNNIVTPCAATAAVSPDCFYYVITNAQEVSSTVTYQFCKIVDINTDVCEEYDPEQATFSYLPPFIYSFQCSSTLVTNYASIFVYMFLIDAFVKPLFYWLLSHISRNSSSDGSKLKSLADTVLPSIWKSTAASSLNIPFKPLVNRDTVVLSIVNTSAIMLTFGVVFPLLSVVIALNVVIGTTIWSLAVGRALIGGRDEKLTLLFEAVLTTECTNIGVLLRDSFWLVVPVAAVFYSMFLFDTIGDALGWRRAVWAPLTIIFIPIAVNGSVAVFGVMSRGIAKRNRDNKERESEMVGSIVPNPVLRSAELDRGSEF